MRKQHPKPFAEVLAEVRATPVEPPSPWPTVGRVHDGVLTDHDGRQFETAKHNLSMPVARKLANTAEKVVLDECGCGGSCGFIPLSNEQISEYMANKRGQAGGQKAFSFWQAHDGATLLMISDYVPFSGA